jgi:hypothetical protein
MSNLRAAAISLSAVCLCLALSVGFAFAVNLPQGSAVFETSLQSRISASDTSMTLVSNALRGGETISGYNCFTIDEGRSDSEFVCGTVSGNTVADLERGLSFSTGTTTVPALKFAHRVGANVKITDFPLLQRVRHQLSGTDTIASIIRYTSHPTFTQTTDLVDKKYVDDTAFSGAAVIDATASARGVVELATGAEASAGTAAGSSGVLALPASIATSTCQFATNSVLVASSTTGKLGGNCFDASYKYNFSATTTFAGTPGNGLSINGVGYSFPSVQGASSTMLATNGAGRLSWVDNGYTLLAATTTTATLDAATTTFATGNFENLFLVIISDANTNTLSNINFNNDVGANYAITRSTDNNPSVKASGASTLSLDGIGSTGTTSSKFLTMNIQNPTSTRKSLTFSLTMSSGTTIAPIVYSGVGIWNNTSSKITSIRFTTSSSLPAGSRIMVYGY